MSSINLTPYIGNASRATPDRCKRRWNDVAFVNMDMKDSRWLGNGKMSGTEIANAVRERFILYLNCIESKPGQEPTAPYLYPKNH